MVRSVRTVHSGHRKVPLMTTTTQHPDTQTTSPEPTGTDEERLMSFVFRAVGEVGAALNGALVVLGDQLGYYRTMAAHGPITPTELAETTSTGGGGG